VSKNFKLRSDIQFLRAIAVIAVVIYHANPLWLPGGYLGVDIFFVISGFVITQVLINKTKKYNIWKFWLQRFFRIVPAYAVMVTIVAFVTAIIFIPENFDQFKNSWKKSLIFLSNQYYAGYGDYFSPKLIEQPLLHTWSLSVEMQYYLIYPIIFLLFIKFKKNGFWFLLISALLTLAFSELNWRDHANKPALYFALHIRFFEFFIGSLLAYFTKYFYFSISEKYKLTLAITGLLIIFISYFIISEKNFSPLTAAYICLGTALVIFGNASTRMISKIYNNKVILFVGITSYSIYLWHWPSLAFFRYTTGNIEWTILYFLSYILLTVCLALLSNIYIENKFRLKSLVIDKIILRKILLLTPIVFLPFFLINQLNHKVSELPKNLTRYADDSVICHGIIQKNCIRGITSSPKLLIIGDSHAAQLNLTAEVIGNNLGIGIKVITAGSCIPLEGFFVGKLTQRAQEPCAKLIKQVKNELIENNNIILAGMWSYQFKDDPEFINVLGNFFEFIEKNEKKTLVLGQIPELKINPTRLLRMKSWGLQVPIAIEQDWKDANNKLSSVISGYSSVKFFNPSNKSLFLNPPFFNGQLIYLDNSHLNEVGAKEYANFLLEIIKLNFELKD